VTIPCSRTGRLAAAAQTAASGNGFDLAPAAALEAGALVDGDVLVFTREREDSLKARALQRAGIEIVHVRDAMQNLICAQSSRNLAAAKC